MNPIQEAKQELEASIRYAENAIASAKQTIESIAKSQEQTGREQALQTQVTLLEERIFEDAKTIEKLRKEKEASSGPCGCQAYRDLEERADSLVATIQRLKQDQPTMPVIPKAVAIAIFREGMQHGVEAACSEIDNTNDIEINESEYCGDFEVSFSKYIDLSDHLDTDWMRGKVGDYSEEFVIDALGTLCADNEFECRIHGVDDQEEKKND